MTAIAKNYIRFNYQDYLLMPEDKRYELIDGEFYMTPAPLMKHQIVLSNLFSAIDTFVRKNELGRVFCAPTDVYLSDEDVVQPDLFFISAKRQGMIEEKFVRGAPDLVIEILSPSTAKRDNIIKRRLYAKYGVQEYWIVDPEAETIEVMVWQDTRFQTLQVYPAGSTFSVQTLSGLKIAVNPVFE